MVNLTARTLRHALNLGPLEGECVQEMTLSTEQQQSILSSSSKVERSSIYSASEDASTSFHPGSWFGPDNASLSHTWGAIFMEQAHPFPSFHDVCKMLSTIYDEHFALSSLQMGPLQPETEDQSPGLDHRALSTEGVHRASAEILEGLSRARRACQKNGTLGLPLCNQPLSADKSRWQPSSTQVHMTSDVCK